MKAYAPHSYLAIHLSSSEKTRLKNSGLNGDWLHQLNYQVNWELLSESLLRSAFSLLLK